MKKFFKCIIFFIIFFVLVFLNNFSCALRTTGTYEGEIGTIDTIDYFYETEMFDTIEEYYESDSIEDELVFDYENTDIECPDGWLTGWKNRISLTVVPDGTDENLEKFPFLIHIGKDSGINHVDLSFVFEELNDYDERFKVAITDFTGTNQLSGEIEKWDINSREGFIWVQAPLIPLSTGANFYFYFDSNHADNVSWIGDTGSIAGQYVWDENGFEGVWHLSSIGGYGSVKDSTWHRRNGTPSTEMNSSTKVFDGLMGNAIFFDNYRDYIDIGKIESNNWMALTVEAWFNAESIVDDRLICKAESSNLSTNCFCLGVVFLDSKMTSVLRGTLVTDGIQSGQTSLDSSSGINKYEWIYGAITWSLAEGAVSLYLNGLLNSSNSNGGNSIRDSNENVAIGNINTKENEDRFFHGLIDEIRVSSVARSSAWIKTSHLAAMDSLIQYGLLERCE